MTVMERWLQEGKTNLANRSRADRLVDAAIVAVVTLGPPFLILLAGWISCRFIK